MKTASRNRDLAARMCGSFQVQLDESLLNIFSVRSFIAVDS